MSSAVDVEPPTSTETGWYVYGVVASSARPSDLASVPSVDPAHEVELVAAGPVAALASKVSLAEFDEPAIAEHLEDPSWLEEKIRAHEQVLERMLASASVAPFRFCTIYRSESELRRLLSERAAELTAAIRHIQGRVELGVKAFVDRARFAEATPDAGDAESGRAYMERRLAERRGAEEFERFAAELAETAHARLLRVAGEGTLLRVHSRELSGRSDEMILNAAYLVDTGDETLGRAVEDLRRDYSGMGVTFEVTGPWPAYNFVGIEPS
jgi:hypothetical protein